MIVVLDIRPGRAAAAGPSLPEYRWLKIYARRQNRFVELLIDEQGVRARTPTTKGLVPAASIEELALVRHGGASCTLLMRSTSGFITRVHHAQDFADSGGHSPQYLELGTLFDNLPAGAGLAEQLKQLGYRVATYTWPELLGKLSVADATSGQSRVSDQGSR